MGGSGGSQRPGSRFRRGSNKRPGGKRDRRRPNLANLGGGRRRRFNRGGGQVGIQGRRAGERGS